MPFEPVCPLVERWRKKKMERGEDGLSTVPYGDKHPWAVGRSADEFVQKLALGYPSEKWFVESELTKDALMSLGTEPEKNHFFFFSVWKITKNKHKCPICLQKRHFLWMFLPFFKDVVVWNICMMNTWWIKTNKPWFKDIPYPDPVTLQYWQKVSKCQSCLGDNIAVVKNAKAQCTINSWSSTMPCLVASKAT